jgi:hypothetical protein
MPYAVCPGCDENVYISSRVKVSAIVHCSHCDSDLEVISIDPYELDWPYLEDDEDDEEWEDDDEVEDDDLADDEDE